MLNKSLWASLFFAILIALLLRTFVFSVSYVPTASMVPSLYPGDYVILNHFVYQESLPKKGDVIVYTKNDEPGIFFAKRVVALPGDTVEVRNGFVFVNENQAEYGDLSSAKLRLEKFPDTKSWHWVYWDSASHMNLAQQKVRDGSILVLADHRLEDSDLKLWDSVPLPRVKARVELIIFSTGESRWSRVLKTVD